MFCLLQDKLLIREDDHYLSLSTNLVGEEGGEASSHHQRPFTLKTTKPLLVAIEDARSIERSRRRQNLGAIKRYKSEP